MGARGDAQRVPLFLGAWKMLVIVNIGGGVGTDNRGCFFGGMEGLACGALYW